MEGYEIKVRLLNVAEGDATSLAQDICDEHGESFDAALGEFEVSVSEVNGDFRTPVDWTWTPGG